MLYNMKKLIVFPFFFLITHLFFCREGIDTTTDTKGIYTTVNKKSEYVSTTVISDLNTLEVFKKSKKNDIVTFLVGNDDYQANSGFPDLQQCENDTRLMARLLTVCCKVPQKNVTVKNNMTLAEFKRVFTTVTGRLKAGQGFLFMYSGHGDVNGSLVFTDGGLLTPDELKKMVNGFAQDTIIILDACYSGMNDGPVERTDMEVFKDNCVRVYSSLAHMQSKEIAYTNEYFAPLKQFYKNTLGLTGTAELSGNGYFTSLIGFFFAEYDFTNCDNVGIRDILVYITNKSKQYVEYLAVRGEDDHDYSRESALRQEQLPKIFPLKRSITYYNPYHAYLILRNYHRPLGITPHLISAPFISFGTFPRLPADKTDYYINKPTAFWALQVTYDPFFLKGLFFGIEAGYLFFVEQGVLAAYMVPIVALIGYRHYFLSLKNMLSFYVSAGGGGSMDMVYLAVNQQVIPSAGVAFRANGGLSVHPVPGLRISLGITLHGVIKGYDDTVYRDARRADVFLGLMIPFSIAYTL